MTAAERKGNGSGKTLVGRVCRALAMVELTFGKVVANAKILC
ncbi:hypothetical protein [uncultured Aliiroseovarius sp.]|nr:hypothetical protein [uncultured Aliiroseovarius sp.]